MTAEEEVDLDFLSSDWLFRSGDGLTWFWLGGSGEFAVIDRLNLEIFSFHSPAPTFWVCDNLGDRIVVVRHSKKQGELI